MSYRVVSGEKVRQARGNRTMREIVANGGFTIGAYWQWENGRQPSRRKLPDLLRALGCSYEAISEPMALTGDRESSD